MPPGPALPRPLLLGRFILQPTSFLVDCERRYGEYFTLRLSEERTMVITSDPEAVKTVFTGDPAQMLAGKNNEILRPLLGDRSVLLLDGGAHMRQRKLMLPPFHGERMKAYGETMRAVAERHVAAWPHGAVFAAAPSMQAITLEIILRTVFGLDDAERIERVGAPLRRLLDASASQLRLLALQITSSQNPRPRSPWGRFNQLVANADRVIYEEIHARRAQADAGAHDDILSMLLEARDEDGKPLTDLELRDELMTLLLAGHETTATALSWTLERLVRHPAVVERLVAERRGGEDAAPYLEATIKEALRLRPVVTAVGRHLTAPLEVGGHLLPAGVSINPSIYLLHRRPDLYPEPEAFRPERFLDNPPGTYQWIPFGGGVRRCLGASFALYEMRIVLQTILDRVSLVPQDDADERVTRRAITFAPKRGARMSTRSMGLKPTPVVGNRPVDPLDGLVGQAAALAAGEVSSRELTERALERIEATQPTLNAFRVVCAEQALADADESDRRLAAGERAPLLGVPVAIKDDVDLAGHETPFGCPGEHRPAERDAEPVRRLRAGGAIVVGKTNAPEVGQWHFSETEAFGATRNPWHLEHTPGGSSGGAAAAVAAGIVAGAMGSDGAGSIRIPAAWTNLVGLKPQRGRVSTWPDAEAFNGLTCYGPLTRTVADSALLLDVLAGNVLADRHQVPAPAEPFAAAADRPPERLRIALSFATPIGATSKVDAEHRAAVEALAVSLIELGHEVEARDPDYGLVGAALIPRGMSAVEAWLTEREIDRAQLEPRTRVHARMGRLLSGAPARAARAAEQPLRRRMGAIFGDVDLVLTPTTAQAPPRIDQFKGRGYWATSTAASATCPFAWPWNVVGWPALSVPAGFTAAGLPIGAQLVAPAAGEALLLSLAGQLEQGCRWNELRPPHQA